MGFCRWVLFTFSTQRYIYLKHHVYHSFGSVCTESHCVICLGEEVLQFDSLGYSWNVRASCKRKTHYFAASHPATHPQSIHRLRPVNGKKQNSRWPHVWDLQRSEESHNTAEEVWTMICYRPAHSRPIICQFRTVHFLVNILVSGKISVSSLFVSLLELVVKLGQRTVITDERQLPPLASVSPGVSFAGAQCGGGGGGGWEHRMI